MANDHAVYIEDTLPAAKKTLARLKKDLDSHGMVLHIEKVTITTLTERV